MELRTRHHFLVILAFLVTLNFTPSEEIQCKFRQGPFNFDIELLYPGELSCPMRDDISTESSKTEVVTNSRKELRELDSSDKANEGFQFNYPGERNEELKVNDSTRQLYKELRRIGKLKKRLDHITGRDRTTSTNEPETDVQFDSSNNNNGDENELLGILQNEFLKLRKELNSSKSQLREKNLQLNITQQQLKSNRINLIEITRKLLSTEFKLDEVRNEKIELMNQLDAKERTLQDTSEKLKNMTDNFNDTFMKLNESENVNNFLKGRVRYYADQLNYTGHRLRETVKKYHNLNVQHEELFKILSGRERQLRECLKSKTNQYCGFENDHICGYEQDVENDIFNWTRHNGETPSRRTGPRIDHTCLSETGHYLYVEASSRGPGQNTRILSPKYVSVNDEQCLEFYYHMYGRNCGTLKVQLQVQDTQASPLWQMAGNQGDVWSVARLHIPRNIARKGYRIVFEGILDNGYYGDIAIDDVGIIDGPCPNDRGNIIVMEQMTRDDSFYRRSRDWKKLLNL